MRYPVGFRPTIEDACNAARESASMTGLRYRVHVVLAVQVAHPVLEVSRAFAFEPVEIPDPYQHMAVRV